MGHQLTLFDFMIPDDRIEYTNVYEFISNLPVFYWGHQTNDLYELNRQFIFHKIKYKLKVKRTRISKDVDEFLNGKDQDILDTILYLTTLKDTNAIVRPNGKVMVKLSIYKIYRTLGGKISYEDIKKGIQKLKETQLEITPDTNQAYQIKWNCETIISQYMIKDNRFSKSKSDNNADVDNQNNDTPPDDETYIELSSAFSSAIVKGKVKLINFPKYMSLTNPISKYLYKQLTLFDFFSKDEEKIYHNKSLFEFLANGGFVCDTTQNKNNIMYSFRKAMDELEDKGLIKSYHITDIKQGRKIIDYKLDYIKPSSEFIDENFKQRKKLRFRKKKTYEKLSNRETL